MGAGAIGAAVAGWLAPRWPALWVLARPHAASGLRERGITLYRGDRPGHRESARVQVITDLGEVPDPDVVVLAVKNYHLEAAALEIRKKLGDRPVIVSLANGISNQEILPRHFTRIVYGVVNWNGWADEPGVIGYQKKGPLLLGALRGGFAPGPGQLAEIFGRGLPTAVAEDIQSAIHCKIAINLVNSITTLVGYPLAPIADLTLFQKLVSGLLAEGVGVLRASGYRECRLGGMPSWALIELSARAPAWLTRPLFAHNIKKLVISSMGQDVLLRHGRETELDSINGRIVALAEARSLPAPFNRKILALCRREFARTDFKPLPLEEVWKAIEG